MISPAVLRELSYCRSRLLAVARILSRLEQRLTLGEASDKMALMIRADSDLSSTRSESEGAEPNQLRLGE